MLCAFNISTQPSRHTIQRLNNKLYFLKEVAQMSLGNQSRLYSWQNRVIPIKRPIMRLRRNLLYIDKPFFFNVPHEMRHGLIANRWGVWNSVVKILQRWRDKISLDPPQALNVLPFTTFLFLCLELFRQGAPVRPPCPSFLLSGWYSSPSAAAQYSNP